MSSPDLPPVLVVGLGLIGGSVALALRREGVSVRGASRSEQTLHTALEIGAVEGASLDVREEAPRAGLILLAAPTRTSIRLVPTLGGLASPGTIITDACSSKRELVSAMDALPGEVRAVGGHPMAGKETAGIKAAEASLFVNTTWVLTETARTDDWSRATCERLVEACGAKSLWVSAEEHDRAVAAISHLPLLAAAALVLAAEDCDSDLVWRLASSGFRDTTRLAAGDAQMGADLLLTNSDEVSAAHSRFARKLAALIDASRENDTELLAELLQAAASRRRELYRGEQA